MDLRHASEEKRRPLRIPRPLALVCPWAQTAVRVPHCAREGVLDHGAG